MGRRGTTHDGVATLRAQWAHSPWGFKSPLRHGTTYASPFVQRYGRHSGTEKRTGARVG
jgi:hypothetical protein